MLTSLSSHNVIQDLQEAGLCSSEEGVSTDSELPQSSKKNFNLLVTLKGNRQLLVKQERHIDNDGKPQEFFNEWLFHQLLERFPALGSISAIASLVVYFDRKKSILVRNYLKDYQDTASFYRQNLRFPNSIATAIGTSLGLLHRATFKHHEYRDFMATAPEGEYRYHLYNPAQGLGSIGPEIISRVPTNALKFYTLYQRYETIEGAIAELSYEWKPCCLTHNELRLDNILLHSKWEQLDNCLVRLIDWEACAWGDPSFDLGTLVADYLAIGLESLVVDPSLDLDESLHLSAVPFDILQPSILALIQAYLDTFPTILEQRNDFLLRTVQFAGLALLHKIDEKIKQHRYFDNSGICTFQIARSLLTKPQESVMTVFGVSETDLIKPFVKLTKFSQAQKEVNLLRLHNNKARLRGC
ncbi:MULTISPECIES: phosphotransferase [Nostocales]|uniref:Phosphotransferase n=3 Tax=Nostocales TaxID=1161 RepID=A0A0C1QX96_9CYAN|nr:phosphotransferase [Tolypothrix bouteillei]KAF3886010.1 phosphotransferase [Tolypothrix bouteillei VB521301]